MISSRGKKGKGAGSSMMERMLTITRPDEGFTPKASFARKATMVKKVTAEPLGEEAG